MGAEPQTLHRALSTHSNIKWNEPMSMKDPMKSYILTVVHN